MLARSTATSGPLAGSGRRASTGLPADAPESGGVAHRTPGRFSLAAAEVPRTPLLAAAALTVWVLLYPRTPDLAAATYRVALFKSAGLAVWDSRWYAGHDALGYSLLFAPLASAIGLRALACASVLVSVALFERLVVRAYGPRGRAGAACFALAAVGDVWAGRIAFAVGVSVALGAYLAFSSGRPGVAGALAALCAACSPVAGALLALAGVSLALVGRSAPAAGRARRPVAALAVASALVIAALALLFAEGGFEPYPLRSFAATAIVVAAFAIALPARERGLRLGAMLYLACCALALAVHTPMGSNAERFAVLLAGPLLLCTLVSSAPSRARVLTRVVGARGAAALLVWAVWCAWGPVRETAAVAGSAATSASYYAPVKRFLAARARGSEPVRIEVPLTRSHWESALLAGTVSLARGWEKQLEERYDGVLLGGALNASSYMRWLRREAVAYVALPDATLDPSSSAEGRLIGSGLPYLREMFAGAHWRIFAVAGATPIATGPGALLSLSHDAFALRASAPGRFLVRVHYTRYFAVVSGRGCVEPAREGWTAVRARQRGVVGVKASFSLGRALGLDSKCR